MIRTSAKGASQVSEPLYNRLFHMLKVKPDAG